MLLKNCSAIIGLFVLLQMFLSVNCYSGSAMLKTKRNGKSRQKRLLSLITDPQLNFYFEYNSCYAVSSTSVDKISRRFWFSHEIFASITRCKIWILKSNCFLHGNGWDLLSACSLQKKTSKLSFVETNKNAHIRQISCKN